MGKQRKIQEKDRISVLNRQETKKVNVRVKSSNSSANLLTQLTSYHIQKDTNNKSSNSGKPIGLVNAEFCADLLGQIAPKYQTRLSVCSETNFGHISWEIGLINRKLNGEAIMSSSAKKRQSSEDNCSNKENKSSFNFSLWPKSKWVFRTPPNRKLNFNNVKNEEICKPVVVQTTETGRVIYKMNDKINVNLGNFTNKQQINIDKRYLVEEVRIVENKTETEESMEFVAFDGDCQVTEGSEPEELEQHFLSLTCRPKKMKNRQSRRKTCENIKTNLETNLQTNEETPTRLVYNTNKNNEETDEAMEVLEESFTFKFTTNNHLTNGQLFDTNGDEKGVFNFLCEN